MTAPRIDELPAGAGADATDDSEASAPQDQAIEPQVRAAQAALIFRRARASNLFAPLVGALVCWILWNDIDHTALLGWFGALGLVMVWREGVHQGFVRDPVANTLRWARRYEYALWANGLVYGLIGTLLWPTHNLALAAIMLATIIGIAAVGVLVLTTQLRATLAFTVPVLVPAIVMQFAATTPNSVYSALGMSIFMVLIVVEGRGASEHTLAMLRLRVQMDHLALQRQQALDLAQRSSAVKGEFLATMSHEMRTPLHGILGITRLLQSAPPGQALHTRAHELDMIERTGEHLLALINDVLDHSKIEGGHLRLAPADFDLAALVGSVGDLTRVAAAEKGLGVTLALSLPSPCWVCGDASRLRQVLLNLTANAVKFTERGGLRVTVHRAPDGGTCFEVIDSGPGVAADQIEAIFEAFHQADASFGRRHGGTGLGLTIARELARTMGGDLVCAHHVADGADGADAAGARFTLTLPLPDGTSASAPPRIVAPTGPNVRRARVLVAEDNPVNALVAQAMLLHSGLHVDLVVNGAQAVEHAAATRYDLILMDCQMPEIDGFEATRQIRRREHSAGTPAVPIVALTANALASDRRRSLAAGMNDHLAKPFCADDLGALLQRFLR